MARPSQNVIHRSQTLPNDRTAQFRPFRNATRRWIIFSVLCIIAAILSSSTVWESSTHKEAGLRRLLDSLGDEYLLCTAEKQRETIWQRLWASVKSQRPAALGGSSKIYTLRTSELDSPGEAECMLVKHGRVEHTGSRTFLEPMCNSSSACSLLTVPRGLTLLPAFTDAHGHLLDLGQSILSVDLMGARSIRECQQRLETFILSLPDLNEQDWIQGGGWDHTRWSDWPTPDAFPTAKDLVGSSPLLQSRKLCLKRVDFHALWLSPLALQTVIDGGRLPFDDASLPGGLVVRDSSGHPTGVLVDHAMRYALEVIPKWSDNDRRQFLEEAVSLLLSEGIVGVGDAAASIEDITFYSRTANLCVRVYAFLSCESSQAKSEEACYRSLVSSPIGQHIPIPSFNQAGHSDLTFRTIKLFADGALGSWGAALFSPYADRPAERGLLTMNESDVPSIIRFWAEKDFQIATHAIGDRANALVLDAYEQVLQPLAQTKGSDQRARIEHAQILRQQDIKRFTSPDIASSSAPSLLSIIASMQPSQYTSDEHYLLARLGHLRLPNAYPWRSLKRSGSSVIFGSDFPVESPSVLAGMHSATSGPLMSTNAESQALSRLEALRAYTSSPPFGQFQENVLGSLESGKWADWILLDGDVLDNGLDLRNIKVLATIKKGELAWDIEQGRQATCRVG